MCGRLIVNFAWLIAINIISVCWLVPRNIHPVMSRGDRHWRGFLQGDVRPLGWWIDGKGRCLLLRHHLFRAPWALERREVTKAEGNPCKALANPQYNWAWDRLKPTGEGQIPTHSGGCKPQEMGKHFINYARKPAGWFVYEKRTRKTNAWLVKLSLLKDTDLQLDVYTVSAQNWWKFHWQVEVPTGSPHIAGFLHDTSDLYQSLVDSVVYGCIMPSFEKNRQQ